MIMQKKWRWFIKKSKDWFERYKSLFLVVFVVIIFILTPPLTNWVISTEALVFPAFFGFINDSNKDAWIDFFGAIIGGALTLIGVAWTIIDQNNKRREDAMDASKPILVANACTYEKIKASMVTATAGFLNASWNIKMLVRVFCLIQEY